MTTANRTERTVSAIAHIGTAALAFPTLGLSTLLLPGALYLIYRGRSRFVAFHALQTLLFIAAMLLLAGIGYLVNAVTPFSVLGWIILLPVFLLSIGLPVMGGIKALKGEKWIYPFVGYSAGKITKV
ncbi:MAG: DUF4870 domain-containing protein [Fimbriimonadaceae bacterium]